MAATFRQIVNNVLQNIGETQIPSGNVTVTDTYQLQVCNFVNHIKEEVEAATQWAALWTLFNINYLYPNTTQQITDSSIANKSANSRSYFARMYNRRFGREVPLCFNTTTFGIPFLVGEMPLADIIYYNTVLNQTPVAYSTNFAVQDLGQDNLQGNHLITPPAPMETGKPFPRQAQSIPALRPRGDRKDYCAVKGWNLDFSP